MKKRKGNHADFSRSSVKPSGACQWVCGTFFVTQQPGRRESRALPRPRGPFPLASGERGQALSMRYPRASQPSWGPLRTLVSQQTHPRTSGPPQESAAALCLLIKEIITGLPDSPGCFCLHSRLICDKSTDGHGRKG